MQDQDNEKESGIPETQSDSLDVSNDVSPEATSPNKPCQESPSDSQDTDSRGENSALSEEGLRHVVDMIKKMTWIKHEDPNWQETLESLTIRKD